jgi:hypothetical protein
MPRADGSESLICYLHKDMIAIYIKPRSYSNRIMIDSQ